MRARVNVCIRKCEWKSNDLRVLTGRKLFLSGVRVLVLMPTMINDFEARKDVMQRLNTNPEKWPPDVTPERIKKKLTFCRQEN